MSIKRGWWKLKIEIWDDESDETYSANEGDLEHIAEMIKQGVKEGEIVHDEVED